MGRGIVLPALTLELCLLPQILLLHTGGALGLPGHPEPSSASPGGCRDPLVLFWMTLERREQKLKGEHFEQKLKGEH